MIIAIMTILGLYGCTGKESAHKVTAEGGCDVSCSVCFNLGVRCADGWDFDELSTSDGVIKRKSK